jgi:hypothetical protein
MARPRGEHLATGRPRVTFVPVIAAAKERMISETHMAHGTVAQVTASSGRAAIT